MTRRTVGTLTANSNNKGLGRSQQINCNKAQRRPGTGKPSNIQLTHFPPPPLHLTELFYFLFMAHSAAEDHPVSTPAPPSHKKTGASGRPPATQVHAAPVAMNDESDVDVPATASQDCNPHRQAQALNKSTSARRSVQTSHRAVPDDEEEVIEENITDQEDEDNIYEGVDGATLGNDVGQLSHWHVFQIYVS